MTAHRIRWPSRSWFAVVAVVLVVLVTSSLGLKSARTTQFEATTLVQPLEFRYNPVRVARTVSALDRGPHPARSDGIYVTIEPVRGSRFTRVTARGDAPDAVAVAANRRASDLVSTLNRRSTGFAVFEIASSATSPAGRSSAPGAGSFVLMALIATICLGRVALGLTSRDTPARLRDGAGPR